jgi:protein-disulfide isomerase
VASRKAQKEAARQAREQAVAQMKAQQSARTRIYMLGGVIAALAAAAVIVILISSSGGGGSVNTAITKQNGAAYNHAQAQAGVESLLSGIEQSGNILGSPLAPVTITEFGDLVCPVCDDFAVTTEPELITADVRTGKVRLVFRADDTASGRANQDQFVPGQVAARAAGLQGKEWNFVMLTYYEQPADINGQDAELSSYTSAAYWKNRAEQIRGLNIPEWQSELSNPTLKSDVATDLEAANSEAPNGTPTIIVTGAKGSVTYDKSDTLNAVPTLAQLQTLISQVE